MNCAPTDVAKHRVSLLCARSVRACPDQPHRKIAGSDQSDTGVTEMSTCRPSRIN